MPDPYGTEVGNSAEIPDWYEERWLLTFTATRYYTRGMEDQFG